MALTEITFKKLYQQVIYNLKKFYNRSNSSFTLASPFGQILSVVTELFQFNMLQVQNVQRSFDMNDPLNQSDKTARSLAKIGQYNPSRGKTAAGSLKLKLKAGVDVNDDIKGGKIIFTNEQTLKNKKNNLNYILDLNTDTQTYTLSNQVPIVLNILQGTWSQISFTGTGIANQSFVIPVPTGKDIDNYLFKLYVNSELWTPKKNKQDMLLNETAYVPLTSFSGGVDLMFGNGNEGMIPPLGSIVTFRYILTDGQLGNLVDPVINEFTFIDFPKDYYGNDIDTGQYFDVDVNTKITFGSNGDTATYLKSIMPYVSANFVLVGPDQYKFFLKRLNLFSIIDVYASSINEKQLITNIYNLAKTNTDLLNKININDNTNTLKQLVKSNLNEIILLRKSLLTDGGDNLINIFLIPDIRIFYGQDTDTNYFNIDINEFILDIDEQNRILNYLSSEGLQIITNEVKIIEPVIQRYVVNITARLYDDAIIDNISNEITSIVSDYFITQNRRDRIPPSDLVRILDGVEGIDSINVEFIAEQNENYHKDFLIKAEHFKNKNQRYPDDTEIIMSNGKSYNRQTSLGLDNILGDILIEKNELPIVRGGFSDRWNNFYNITPGAGNYSSVNLLILTPATKRKKLN